MMRTLFAGLLVFSNVAQACAAPQICPKQINLTASSSAPPGFTLYRDGNPPAKELAPGPVNARLTGASFSEGPPEQQGGLAPDAGGTSESVWNFVANKDQTVWISCTYGNTGLMLSKPLPVAILSCTVTSAGAVTCR